MFYLSSPLMLAAASNTSTTIAITQTVTGPAEGVVSAVVVREGAMQNADGVPTLDMAGRKLGDMQGTPTIAVRDYGIARTRAPLLADAKSFIIGSDRGAPGAMLPFAAALKRFMTANNVSVLLFNFNQKVAVAGDPEPKYLLWNVTVHQGQTLYFPDPQVVDTLPSVLQIVYTPKAIATGLSPGLSNPNAGTLQWRKLDTAFIPVGSWTRVDVKGAYDDSAGIASSDKDRGIQCLTNRSSNAACPPVTNVADLINKTGAGYAILDYSRTVQLNYEPVEDPPLSGKFKQVPRVAMSVDYREWTPSHCSGGTFTNRGNIGFDVRSQIDRYAVWADGTSRPIDSFVSQALSPTSSFDVAKSGILGETAESLADKIVDVKNPSGELVTASSIANLANLAPIATRPSNTGNTLVIGDYFYGNCGRAFGISTSCDASGNIQMTLGVSSSVPYCSPRNTKFYQSQTYALRKGVPIGNQTTSLEEAGSFSWSYDGNRMVLFRHGDWASGGDKGIRVGMSIFASQVFFPGKGFHVRQNFPTGGPVDFYFEGKTCPGGTVAGDRIFTAESFWFESYRDHCLRPDPRGALPGACKTLEEQLKCPRYSDAGPKIWAPTQQDPGLPTASNKDGSGWSK